MDLPTCNLFSVFSILQSSLITVAGLRSLPDMSSLWIRRRAPIGCERCGGLSCGSKFATVANGLGPDDCGNNVVTSKLLTRPPDGTRDHNPDRVTPRNLFNLGIGSDNLMHAEGRKRVSAEILVVRGFHLSRRSTSPTYST
jgi:hypothetical protein